MQDEYRGDLGQKWLLRDSKINGWVISPLSNLSLAITIEDTIDNGLKIRLEDLKYNDRQMFYLFGISKAERTKANGTYNMLPGGDSNKAVGGNTSDDSKLNLAIYKGKLYQKFDFEYQEEGYYKITIASTGKSLTVKNNSINKKIEIVQDEFKEELGQKWRVIDSKINGWIITPLENPDLAITVVTNSTPKVILDELQYSNKQMFYLFGVNKAQQTKANGTYNMILGGDLNQAVGAKVEDNSKLDIAKYNKELYQKFDFEYQEEGYYKITVASTNKSLTVKNNSINKKAEIVQDEYKANSGQKWIVKDSKVNGWVILPLENQNLAITADINSTPKIMLDDLQYNNKQMYYLYKVEKDEHANSITLDTTKYPGYKEKLDQLLKEHPKWSFEFLYTGIKFSDAVSGEYSVRKRNLVPTTYSGEWICGTTLYDTGWYGASEKAIAYYMDPRNFLDDINVFQFQDVNEYIVEACTIDGIQSKVSGTFLSGYENDMNNACLNTNVNPYYIIARLIQEQGTKGGSTVKMKDGDKYYYNPFNIGASGDSTSQVIANALARAKAEGWDTMQKALEGGIHFCKVNWLENYQNTLYQNRFDIDSTNGTSLYSHQYMQNLMGAYSEAKTLYSMYKKTEKIDSNFTFIIPLYENMEKELSPIPVNTTETYPINVKTTGTSINLRSDANTSSSIIRVIEEKGTILLSVQRGINSNWNKIVLQDGTIGYMSGTYLTQIDDVKTSNYKAKVKTNDGDGCKIRVGPGLKLEMISVLADNVQVTVIDDTTYKGIDGYDWYRVMLSNGIQGFMPGKYLAKVN